MTSSKPAKGPAAPPQKPAKPANPAKPVTLADRLKEPDVANLPDWEAADLLNRPDPSLPERVDIVTPRPIGIGQVLTALGGDAGAAFLDALAAKGAQRPLLRYVMGLLERGEMDAGSPQVRAEIQAMATANEITQQMAAALLALGENRRQQSWAEANGVAVNARAVGLARGGKP